MATADALWRFDARDAPRANLIVMKTLLDQSIAESLDLLPKLAALAPTLERLGQAIFACWDKRCKLLIAGNGGSMADAMHFAEELSVRFRRNRQALAALALCDVAAITCAGNDFGYDTIFARQVEALGNPGDMLIVFTTSGNSANLLRAIDLAKTRGLVTVAFLGKDGGQTRGRCDFELIIPAAQTARIQEGHQLLFHTLCEWIDTQLKN